MQSSSLVIIQGAEWGYRWPVTPPLTEGSIKAQVRVRVTDPEVLFEWNTEDGSATITPEGITLYVPSGVSSAFTWRKGIFDVEYTDADGAVHRVAQGSVEVNPEVTR